MSITIRYKVARREAAIVVMGSGFRAGMFQAATHIGSGPWYGVKACK